MARDRTLATPPAPQPDAPPPTSGGAFERAPGGELKPIEESADRLKPTEEAPPASPSEPSA